METRTCCVCRGKANKRELTRFYLDDNGQIALDLRQQGMGRGAYVHLTKKCFFSSEARLRLIASIKRVKSKRSLSELKNQVEDKSLKKLISSELENSKVRNKFEREALEKIARLESKTENLKNTKVKQVRL